jgi:uncharacterized membrane protein (UPF0127 family)
VGRWLAVLVALLTIAPGCGNSGGTTATVETQHRTLVVNDEPTDICMALPATVAQRVTGLAYRPSIPDKEGMAFPFAQAQPATFSMKNTSFPLSIVWVGDDSQVLGATTTTALAPEPYASPGAVTLAVQLAPKDWGPLAGTARTVSLGESCDGTITAGRPGQPPKQF